jgi:hypothetical protein
MLADKSDLQIESTVSGNRVAMTLDETALVHIMSVLTNLYSDPEKAIIREYATNAWDAHIEAGILRPIEITHAVRPGSVPDDSGLRHRTGRGRHSPHLLQVRRFDQARVQ